MHNLVDKFLPLYSLVPTALQNGFCSLEGWRIQRTRYNADFDRLWRDANARSGWSTEQVLEYRDDRLRRFLKEAVAFTPHYAAERKRAGFAWEDIKELADLKKLP